MLDIIYNSRAGCGLAGVIFADGGKTTALSQAKLICCMKRAAKRTE